MHSSYRPCFAYWPLALRYCSKYILNQCTTLFNSRLYLKYPECSRNLSHLQRCCRKNTAVRFTQLPPRITAVTTTRRPLHSRSSACFQKPNEYSGSDSSISSKDHMFESSEQHDKKEFLTIIEEFSKRSAKRRGHVEFIYTALKFMEEFGVERDLESYKRLLEVFPQEKMVPQNMFQIEFMHYPKQQQCAIDLLDQMEYHGVMPDKEFSNIILPIFGSRSYVYRKYCRMMYWMPKFKKASPFPLPDPLPGNIMDLAKLAIERICVDLQTKISVYQAEDIEDSLDKTWIVSGQSPQQEQLIREHPTSQPLYVEGPFRIWLRHCLLSYFIIRADAKPLPEDNEDMDDVSSLPSYFLGYDEINTLVKEPSVHEQEDGVILAVCVTGTSSRDSLLSWIRFLQQTNPKLKNIPVVFTLKAPSQAVMTLNEVRGLLESITEEQLSSKFGMDVLDEKTQI